MLVSRHVWSGCGRGSLITFVISVGYRERVGILKRFLLQPQHGSEDGGQKGESEDNDDVEKFRFSGIEDRRDEKNSHDGGVGDDTRIRLTNGTDDSNEAENRRHDT